MSDVPDLAALRRERVASDTEYIEQLEQFSLGQERENARLRALAFLVYRTLSDEPIETLEWLTPEHRDLLAQVVSDLSPHLNPERARTAMQGMRAEWDRLRAVVDHLRESAESAIGQDRDDEYDEGNRDAWLYVRNVLDGRAGPANALDGRPPMNDDEQFAAHYGPGEPVNAAEVAAILAKRDRLRAVVGAVVGTDPPLDGSADIGDEEADRG